MSCPTLKTIELCVDSLESVQLLADFVQLQLETSDQSELVFPKISPSPIRFRIELCSALVEGGLTPSYGYIQQVATIIRQYRHRFHSAFPNITHTFPLDFHVLIRPRAGDFLYSDAEIDAIWHDVRICLQVPEVDGIVCGFLKSSGEIDLYHTREFLNYATDRFKTFVFHRAVDMSLDISKSFEDLHACGVQHILTSFGHQTTVDDSAIRFMRMIVPRLPLVTFIPASGITFSTISALLNSGCPIQALHMSLRTPPKLGSMEFRRPDIYMGGEKRNDTLDVEYCKKVLDVDALSSILTN